jgi:hypothetical protein
MPNSSITFPKLSMSRHLFILLFSMLLCGIISTMMGKDLDWDLANYHYSNAYLFLHHHVNQDFFPPSYVHIHFAPVADLLSYFLINYFTPFQATFISGAIQGINLWLLFQIAYLFLKNTDDDIALSILLAFLGIYGCTVFFCIGNFKNDLLISIFILFFIFGQIKSLQYYKKRNVAWIKWLLIGATSAGIAVGLKLTAGVYIVGSVIAYFFLPIRWVDRVKYIFILCFFCVIGFLFSSGYWMWIQWIEYHNPVFPFFNSIFHSTQFTNSNLFFPNSAPQNIWRLIFLSPYFVFLHNDEVSFMDLRYFYLYALFIITAAFLIWKPSYWKRNNLPCELTWLCFFVIFTHAFYQFYFDGIRYVVAIEMLAPLIIYLLVIYLIINEPVRILIIGILFLSMIISMKPNQTGTRIRWYNNDYFNVVVPDNIKQNPEALALIPYSEYALNANPRPIFFLMGFLPKRWHFIGIPFWHGLYDGADISSEIKTRNIIENYSGKIYFITPEIYISKLYDIAFHFNLLPAGNCQEIKNERSRALFQKVMICPVKKIITSHYTIKYNSSF